MGVSKNRGIPKWTMIWGYPRFLETPMCFYTLLGTNTPPFENEKSYVSSMEGTANGFYHEIPVKQGKKSFLLIHFTNPGFFSRIKEKLIR